MKKTAKEKMEKKLRVNRTVLRGLTEEQTGQAAGGLYRSGSYCSTWLDAKCSYAP
jgi:hypothetical protein